MNRKLPARNTTVQLLTLYTHPKATMHSVTVGTARQTNGRKDRGHCDANSLS